MSGDNVKLFILEDDDKQGKIYLDAIADYYKKKSVEIVVELSKNLEGGLEKLKTADYDAAILDLKLAGDDTEGKGNKIIREIKQKLRFPIFVVSGVLEELDADLREQNIFYKVYNRTEKTADELIDEIITIYNTGITKILGRKGKIEAALQDIFWKHIAKNMDYWKSEIKNPEESERILLRHTLSYLSGYLEMDDAGTFLHFNPAEVYIIPPIIKNIFTGDILKNKTDSKLYVVLTPACDFAQCKAKDVVVAFIEDRDMECLAQQKIIFKKNDGTISVEQKKDAEEIIKKLLKNSHSHKYHFLPPTEQFRGGFINFQKISSIKLSEIPTSYDRIASITEKFMKDIIARFSNYYARQGQPDFNIDELFKKMV